MTEKISRRSFLKLTGVIGGAILLSGCSGAEEGEQSFWDRLNGTPRTEDIAAEEAWSLVDGSLTLDMSTIPALDTLGHAVRIEGDVLEYPILVVRGDDGEYYAFKNVCTHAGRMVDPIAGTMTLECCSASSSTFDYEGNVLSGPAESPLVRYDLQVDGTRLIINLN